MNRYAYCRNNPNKYTDPDGESFTVLGAIVGGVVGVGYYSITHIMEGDFNLRERDTLIGMAGSGFAGLVAGAATGLAVDLTVASGGIAAKPLMDVATSYVLNTVAGGFSNMVGYLGNQIITGEQIEGEEIVESFKYGAEWGFITTPLPSTSAWVTVSVVLSNVLCFSETGPKDLMSDEIIPSGYVPGPSVYPYIESDF